MIAEMLNHLGLLYLCIKGKISLDDWLSYGGE